MKLAILFALALAAYAQEPSATGDVPLAQCVGNVCKPSAELAKSSNVANLPALAYQTARADAAEAKLAVLERADKDNQLTINFLNALIVALKNTAWGDIAPLQAKQAQAQRALEAATPPATPSK